MYDVIGIYLLKKDILVRPALVSLSLFTSFWRDQAQLSYTLTVLLLAHSVWLFITLVVLLIFTASVSCLVNAVAWQPLKIIWYLGIVPSCASILCNGNH